MEYIIEDSKPFLAVAIYLYADKGRTYELSNLGRSLSYYGKHAYSNTYQSFFSFSDVKSEFYMRGIFSYLSVSEQDEGNIKAQSAIDKAFIKIDKKFKKLVKGETDYKLPVKVLHQYIKYISSIKSLVSENFELLIKIAIIEYFMKKYNVMYENSEEFNEFFSIAKEMHTDLVKNHRNRLLPKLEKSSRMANTKLEYELYLEDCIHKATNEMLKIDLLDYIKNQLQTGKIFEDPVCRQFMIYSNYRINLNLELVKLGFGRQDLEYLLTKLEKEYNDMYIKDFKDINTYLDSVLLPSVLIVILLKFHMNDRDYMFKEYSDLLRHSRMKVADCEREINANQVIIKENDNKIKKLTDEKSRLNEQLKETPTTKLKEQLKKLNDKCEILEIRIQEKEQELTEKHNREKEDLIKNHNEEINKLNEEIAKLVRQLPEGELNEYEMVVPTFNTSKTLFVAGHCETINKIKKIFPKAKYVELDRNGKIPCQSDIEYIFNFKNYSNHCIINAVKSTYANKKIYNLVSTNPNRILEEMNNYLEELKINTKI